MRTPRNVLSALTITTMLTVGACGGKNNTRTSNGDIAPPAATSPSMTPTSPAAGNATTAGAQPYHHSKIAGALVGAAAGHVLGGHAVAGAAVGAMVQHHRNKRP